MKKGKSRNKRKKTRSRLLWIAIAVIGIAAVISAVCVAGMLATKENAWRTPEELLVEYMDYIPKQEYEEMYAMLHIEASGNISQEDFIKRNSAIYEGIEVQNMAVQIIAYDEEQMMVTYQTSFDTVAGTISFENEALFLKDEEGYKLVWDDSMIFPNLTSTDKVRVSTTQAERGEILDRNGRVLAGKGTASSVGIVPGKLENREEAIVQIAEEEEADMLLRKTTWFWKSGLAAISFVLILSISGCSDAPPEENTVSETVIDVQAIQEESEEDADEIISVCIDLYEKAEEENKLADLETIRSIVNRLGENGYPAVDSRNQINMTEPEKVVKFCEKVDAQEEAEITILEISYLGGFVKYDLHTKDGNVDVVRSYYKYENGNMKREVIGNYQAEYWNYTEEGYLMFSGVWFSEELYVLTLSGAEEHTALRVQPLDETYRELSRKYLNPISFERNNMFIVDWSEEDFGDLNFYDMYDILYPKVNGQYAPYVADDNLSVSAVYRIPKEEFESVIMKYFNIDSETLQSKTVYYSEDSTYEYKPRGFEEVEYPEYPYSEVVDFTENSDGTITLTANVVFPYAGDSKVYAHEVVVRPLEDGGVQYVSNQIIPSEDNYEETWHTPRLTLEEWEELYGGE